MCGRERGQEIQGALHFPPGLRLFRLVLEGVTTRAMHLLVYLYRTCLAISLPSWLLNLFF